MKRLALTLVALSVIAGGAQAKNFLPDPVKHCDILINKDLDTLNKKLGYSFCGKINTNKFGPGGIIGYF